MTEHDRARQNNDWADLTDRWTCTPSAAWRLAPAWSCLPGRWGGAHSLHSTHTELEILRFCLVNFVVLIKDKWAVPLFTPSLQSLSPLLLHLDFLSILLEVKYSFSVLYRNYNLLVRFCVLSIMNLMMWSTLAGLNWTKIGNHSFDHHVMWSSSKMWVEWLQEVDDKNFYKE